MTAALRKILRWKTLLESSKNGLQSIEAIVWVPFVVLVMALGVNSALIHFNESRLLRVVQRANHLLSIGDLHSEAETENYILTQLSEMSDSLVVESVVDNGLIITKLTIPVADFRSAGIAGKIHPNGVITISAQETMQQ